MGSHYKGSLVYYVSSIVQVDGQPLQGFSCFIMCHILYRLMGSQLMGSHYKGSLVYYVSSIVQVDGQPVDGQPLQGFSYLLCVIYCTG